MFTTLKDTIMAEEEMSWSLGKYLEHIENADAVANAPPIPELPIPTNKKE